MATPPPPPPPLVRAPTAQPAVFTAQPFDAPAAAVAAPAPPTVPLSKKGSGVPGGATSLTATSATAAPAPAANPPPPPPAALGPAPFKAYKRAVRLSPAGCAVYAAYLAALAFYLWVRITKTLGLGRYTAYGAVVLGVECLGATTVLIYGLNLLLLPAPTGPFPPTTAAPYHVRVCVPVYKEALDIVRRTVLAARAAPLPGCARTVYLCDDGRDPKKRAWVAGLADPGVVYVSGRKRPAGEVNGKSGNINNLLTQLYGCPVTGYPPASANKGKDGGGSAPAPPPGPTIPGTELLCIFDADQVASADFFTQTLHLFDGGDDVGMVLSPQVKDVGVEAGEQKRREQWRGWTGFFGGPTWRPGMRACSRPKTSFFLSLLPVSSPFHARARSASTTCPRTPTSSTTRTCTSGSTRRSATTRWASSAARGPTFWCGRPPWPRSAGRPPTR